MSHGYHPDDVTYNIMIDFYIIKRSLKVYLGSYCPDVALWLFTTNTNFYISVKVLYLSNIYTNLFIHYHHLLTK